MLWCIVFFYLEDRTEHERARKNSLRKKKALLRQLILFMEE
jgi:hypothetical protein